MAYSADALFSLRVGTAREGMPAWANLSTTRKVNPIPEELCGPGIYALFFDGVLTYIGLHAGNAGSFSAPVLVRWENHVLYHTLRAKSLTFHPRPLEKILGLAAPAIDELAACLPAGRMTRAAEMAGHALIGQAHSTYKKACFAMQNWDLIGPGNEAELLSRYQCIFRKIPPQFEALLGDVHGEDRGYWVRELWLRAKEAQLIQKFRPQCNHETKLGSARLDVTIAEVEVALDAVMAGPYPAFDRAQLQALRNKSAPATLETIEALGIGERTFCGAERDEAVELGVSESEQQIRGKLTVDGLALLNNLIAADPTELEVYFTQVPDIRISARDSNRVLMVMSALQNGRLNVKVRADLATCAARGFEAVEAKDSQMRSQFYVDPAQQGAQELWALALGAARALRVAEPV